MKAVRVLEYGGQLVFDDVSTPTIARDEILVRIESTTVNHVDIVKASGAVRQILPIDLPWIPGHEFRVEKAVPMRRSLQEFRISNTLRRRVRGRYPTGPRRGAARCALSYEALAKEDGA